MIDLYTWSTPNGRKVSIMLEETGLPYRVHPINLREGHQLSDTFRDINPNQRIPAIVDHDLPDGPLTVFESGAILIYLAEKTRKFLPTEVRSRSRAIQWLMFQMSGIGPMLGQANHFATQAPEPIPYATKRYFDESLRLLGVLDRRLGEHDFLAGDYSIADMATWPWISRYEWQTMDLAQYPNVLRWYKAIAARPAVQKGYHVPVPQPTIPMP